MVLKKSKIKIPYIRLNFQIVRQSDARWCERSKIPHQEEFSPTRLALSTAEIGPVDRFHLQKGEKLWDTARTQSVYREDGSRKTVSRVYFRFTRAQHSNMQPARKWENCSIWRKRDISIPVCRTRRTTS